MYRKILFQKVVSCYVLHLVQKDSLNNAFKQCILHKNVKLRKSKSYDLRYHWIRDRCDQGHFGISWAKGKSNLADFLTKTHPVKHFKNMRSFFVQDAPLYVPRNTALTRRNFKKSQLPVTTVPSANSGTRFQKGVLEQPTAAGISWFPGFVGANRFAPLAFTNQ